MQPIMLDTAACVDLVRGDAPELARALPLHRGGPIVVSVITLAELRVGDVLRPPSAGDATIDDLLAPFEVLPFDRQAAQAYGTLRVTLERKGTPIGPMDTLIAAHAIAVGAAIITANVRDFRRVPGLTVSRSLPLLPHAP